MSVLFENMAHHQNQLNEHLAAQQTQMTKDIRKPVPTPRQLEGTNPTVTGVKAFLKEIEDLHAGHAGASCPQYVPRGKRQSPHFRQDSQVRGRVTDSRLRRAGSSTSTRPSGPPLPVDPRDAQHAPTVVRKSHSA